MRSASTTTNTVRHARCPCGQEHRGREHDRADDPRPRRRRRHVDDLPARDDRGVAGAHRDLEVVDHPPGVRVDARPRADRRSPMKCARWSCQRAVVPLETRRHTGCGVGVGARRRPAGDRGRAVEVRRRRARVLEHAAWADAQVRLAVVAEHEHLGAPGVGQLDLGAEVDDRQREPGDRRRHPLEHRLVVRRRQPADARARPPARRVTSRRPPTTAPTSATARSPRARCSSGLGGAQCLDAGARGRGPPANGWCRPGRRTPRPPRRRSTRRSG